MMNRRLILFLLLGMTASGYGIHEAALDTQRQLQRPVPLVPDARYHALRRQLGNVKVCGFVSDRIRKAGNPFYFGAQYALAPIHMIREPLLPSLSEKLARGYDLLCDFQDPAFLEVQLARLPSALKSRNVAVEIYRFAPGLALISTRKNAP